MFTFCLLYCDLWMKMKWKNNTRGSYMRKNGMQSCHNLIWFRWLIHAFFGSPCRWNNAQTEHHQEPNFHHYNDDMSTNEDLHHKREQNGDEELTSMLQRYLDNSCSNISGSMGKNKAIETDIIFIDRPSGSYNIPNARHYNQWFVYFLANSWSPFLCFQGSFLGFFFLYVC